MDDVSTTLWTALRQVGVGVVGGAFWAIGVLAVLKLRPALLRGRGGAWRFHGWTAGWLTFVVLGRLLR